LSREFTVEEIRDEFLNHLVVLVDYWYDLDKPKRESMEGLLFSVLATLDGVSGFMPGYIVAPSTHEDDKQYHIDNGSNYYPQNHESDVKADIGGSLHELIGRYYKEER
jgi:hypothetical protein